MDIISQSLSHTPIWVYALFAFLVSRGLKSLQPRETTLGALALILGTFAVKYAFGSVGFLHPELVHQVNFG